MGRAGRRRRAGLRARMGRTAHRSDGQRVVLAGSVLGAPASVQGAVASGVGPGSGGGWITLAALRVDQFGRPLTHLSKSLAHRGVV
jgi:hypothetical protein